MKAIVYNHGSPDVLKLEEIERPTPGDDEVLINVRAASVNSWDSGLSRHPFLRRILFAMSKSKVNRPGRDVAGPGQGGRRNGNPVHPGGRGFGFDGGGLCGECKGCHTAVG